MQQLIAIQQTAIRNETIPTCNARDLHRFLEVETRFNDWIERRIEEYDFIEGQDFCSNLSKSTGGRPAKEYAVSLDMAKELSMVERTEKGKQARQYFIDCERQVKGGRYAAKPLPKTKQAAEASKTFNALFRTMRLIGLDKNAAAISANQGTRKVAGMDVLALTGNTHLEAENQASPHYTPTELGQQIGNLSAQKVNQLLEAAGLQERVGTHWQPTIAGRAHAFIADVGKRHTDGAPVTQLKWYASAVPLLERADVVTPFHFPAFA